MFETSIRMGSEARTGWNRWGDRGLGERDARQLVSWPKVLTLHCEWGDGVSLASYAIVLVSMSLYLVHATAIGDTVAIVSIPLSLIPTGSSPACSRGGDAPAPPRAVVRAPNQLAQLRRSRA
jgi:hypothetical protein